jgi:hypothetical protein
MTMRKQGETVQAEVSKQVAIDCYHMLMVVLELFDDRNLEDFEAVGGRAFEMGNTESQHKYYQMMMEDLDEPG